MAVDVGGVAWARVRERVLVECAGDMRNRYASFEAIFVRQNWHSRCLNRLS